MAILATGAIFAKIVGLATTPIITRLYSPEHFGLLSVFASIAALIAPFGTLRYSLAVPLPRIDSMAANILALSLAILTSTTVVLFLLFWGLSPQLFSLFSVDHLVPYWWLLVLTFAGAGLYEILSSWATRRKAFQPLAKTSLYQAVSSALIKISLGLLGIMPAGLLIGHSVSLMSGSTTLAAKFYHELKSCFKFVSRKRMGVAAKRYQNLPALRLPSQFLLVFAMQAPLLFTAVLFDAKTAGQLGLAFTVLALPMSLFGNTTGQAYYAEICKIGPKQPEKIYRVTANVAKKLFFISLPPFLVLQLAGPFLFAQFFGVAWTESGRFASILAFYLMSQFVSTPLVNVFTVFGKQWFFLRINIFRCVTVLFVFGLSYLLSLNPFNTILLYSLLLAFNYLINVFLVFRLIKQTITARGEG